MISDAAKQGFNKVLINHTISQEWELFFNFKTL